MENRLELVHFQITRNCNLRCHFCGQWGKKGVFSDAKGEEMTLEEWKKIAQQLKQDFTPIPDIMLWGGEPFMCKHFDELAVYLKEEGFRLGIVTNGVLADSHLDVINHCIDRIYLSIDGEREVHNAIRGNHVYEKVCENLKKLPKEKVQIMTVLTKELQVESFLKTFSDYKILLQEMIPFETKEIVSYYGELSDNVAVNRHGDLASQNRCQSPYHHLHITWNGNVSYCTDYYDYSIGNVRECSLKELWTSDEAETMRGKIASGAYAGCAHCSWKNNTSFYF